MMNSTLLPLYEGLRIDGIASQPFHIIVHLSTVAESACCPECGQATTRVHSQYQRTLADLPWNQVAVRLHLKTRKFFCDHPCCKRRIFTEPLPQLTQRYAHKTRRLTEALYLIGYALGGEAGARVAVGLGLSVSPDTLLNRVRQEATDPVAVPAVRSVGVDDWAFRKGQRYGTILIDLDKHQLLDLLPDRSSKSLAEWLEAHPEIEIVSRDRASVYSEGARVGAPQAKQVADRFHLLKNLVEALQRMLLRYQKPIHEAGKQVSAPLASTEPLLTQENPSEGAEVVPS